MQPGRFPRSSRTQKEERPVAPFQIACRCCPYDWRQKGGWRYTASVARIGKPGGLTLSQLPHHRTYGSVYGGSGRTRKSPALTVKAHEILVTQHPLDDHRGLLPSGLSTCRVRLARESRTLGGSAAYSPGSLRHLSHFVCTFLRHRTRRTGLALPVRPFTTVRRRRLRPRLTSAHLPRRLATALANGE